MVFTILSCQNQNPNIDDAGVDELESLAIANPIDTSKMNFHDIVYVPIYSDIYVSHQNQKSLLAATLSIRNTSYTDSLFISKIEYFNSEGNLVRNYIEGPISLTPMATVNYVIEREDTEGGSGANFIVEIRAKNINIRPLIHAVMIGDNGSNQGFAFAIDGYSILNPKK
jgi:hypothetical protein